MLSNYVKKTNFDKKVIPFGRKLFVPLQSYFINKYCEGINIHLQNAWGQIL